MSTYNYTLSGNFPSGLDNSALKNEIDTDVIITKNCTGINTSGDNVSIMFDMSLDAGEQTELNNVITNYVYAPPKDVREVEYLKTKDYSKSYLEVTFNFTNIDNSDFKKSDGHSINNVGDSDYNTEFDLTGKCIIKENGFYIFSLFLDNSAPLGNDTYKIEMREKSGSGKIYARTFTTRSEPTGDLNNVISSSLYAVAGYEFEFFMKELTTGGAGNFTCILQVVRIK